MRLPSMTTLAPSSNSPTSTSRTPLARRTMVVGSGMSALFGSVKPEFLLPSFDVVEAGLYDIGVLLAEALSLLRMVEDERTVVLYCAQHDRRDVVGCVEAQA